MKKEISIEEFIQNLCVKIPERKEFLQLSRIIPINPIRPDNFIVNFERGMLLYALIAKFQPKTVLEIGTAEGYSTLCMAWAMSDHKINGKIFTIDPKSHQQVIERLVKIKETEKPVKMFLSREEYWKKFVSQKWIDKIEVITGYSREILNTKRFPEIEFCYIDGSHVYDAVKCDFFAVLKLVSKKFNILFDDYIPNKNSGVTKVIDEEIMNVFETTLIKTNTKKQRIELKLDDEDDELIMCFLNSSSLKKPLWETYDEKNVDKFLSTYRFIEKRIKIRKKLDKKIPFLKNIKFQWWKNK